MFTQNVKPGRRPRRGPGRPPGPTAQGIGTRKLLYETAVRQIAAHGYEGTTLRGVAEAAKVSAGLLYRYFPSKRAVVLALYDDLSAAYASRAAHLPRGRWRERYMYALRTSLEVLAPHRRTLSALVPVLIGSREDGLFAANTAFSRRRVQAVFENAVAGATDAPGSDLAGPLARLLYLVHLAVLLWWLLDKSPRQRATDGLVGLVERAATLVAVGLRFSPVRGIVRSGDALFRDALFDDAAAS